jgi:hypothetical protein
MRKGAARLPGNPIGRPGDARNAVVFSVIPGFGEFKSRKIISSLDK